MSATQVVIDCKVTPNAQAFPLTFRKKASDLAKELMETHPVHQFADFDRIYTALSMIVKRWTLDSEEKAGFYEVAAQVFEKFDADRSNKDDYDDDRKANITTAQLLILAIADYPGPNFKKTTRKSDLSHQVMRAIEARLSDPFLEHAYGDMVCVSSQYREAIGALHHFKFYRFNKKLYAKGTGGYTYNFEPSHKQGVTLATLDWANELVLLSDTEPNNLQQAKELYLKIRPYCPKLVLLKLFNILLNEGTLNRNELIQWIAEYKTLQAGNDFNDCGISYDKKLNKAIVDEAQFDNWLHQKKLTALLTTHKAFTPINDWGQIKYKIFLLITTDAGVLRDAVSGAKAEYKSHNQIKLNANNRHSKILSAASTFEGEILKFIAGTIQRSALIDAMEVFFKGSGGGTQSRYSMKYLIMKRILHHYIRQECVKTHDDGDKKAIDGKYNSIKPGLFSRPKFIGQIYSMIGEARIFNLKFLAPLEQQQLERHAPLVSAPVDQALVAAGQGQDKTSTQQIVIVVQRHGAAIHFDVEGKAIAIRKLPSPIPEAAAPLYYGQQMTVADEPLAPIESAQQSLTGNSVGARTSTAGMRTALQPTEATSPKSSPAADKDKKSAPTPATRAEIQNMRARALAAQVVALPAAPTKALAVADQTAASPSVAKFSVVNKPPTPETSEVTANNNQKRQTVALSS